MHSRNLLLVVSCTSICTLVQYLLLWTRASQYWWQPSKNISCVAYRWGVVFGKFLKNFRFSSSCLSYVLYVFAYQKILQWKRQQHLQFCACMLSRSIQPVLFHGGLVLLSRKSLYENYNGYQIEYLFLKQDIIDSTTYVSHWFHHSWLYIKCASNIAIESKWKIKSVIT